MNKAKLKALAARAGGLVPDALLVGGAGAVSFGAGMVYLPAGWIVGGLFALAGGWMTAKVAK